MWDLYIKTSAAAFSKDPCEYVREGDVRNLEKISVVLIPAAIA